jgi:hypothetical protein
MNDEQEAPESSRPPEMGPTLAFFVSRKARFVRVLVILAFQLVAWKFGGMGYAFLFLAAVALLGVIGALFLTVQRIAEPPEVHVEPLKTVSEAQARKKVALKAIKDIEYERSVGSISDDDYKDMISRYRAEAKEAMRLVDEERSALRSRAEKLAQKAISRELGDAAKKSKKVDAPPTDEPVEASDALPKKDDGPGDVEIGKRKDDVEENVCVKCGATNDDDAIFCKKCGTSLETENVA